MKKIEQIKIFIHNNQNIIYWSVFAFLILALIFLQYYGLLAFHYPDTPGDDTMNHWLYIQAIKEQKNSILQLVHNGGYPPLYHFFILKLSTILHKPEMTIMLWTYPAIIILATFSASILAWAIFKNKIIALLVFIIYGFLSLTPLQLLNDGGYPDLIAAHIILPVILTFFIFGWQAKNQLLNIVWSLFSVLLIILMALMHHLSTYEFLSLVVISLPILIIVYSLKEKVPRWKPATLIVIYLVAVALFIYSYFKFPFFAPFRNLASIMFTFSKHFPFIHSLTSYSEGGLVPLKNFPRWIGWLSVLFGLPFILYFHWIPKLRPKEYFYPTLLLSIWVLMLLLGSQLNFLSNPERLGRDASLPLAILAAASVYFLFNFLRKNKLFLIAFLVVCLLFASLTFRTRLHNALHYEPMVRITQADLKLFDALQNNQNGPILFNTWVFYYGKYLAGWDLHYLPQLNEDEIINIKDGKGWTQKMKKEYQYFYIIDSQQGWAPNTLPGIAKQYLDDPGFQLLAEAVGPTNHVFLFKNLDY